MPLDQRDIIMININREGCIRITQQQPHQHLYIIVDVFTAVTMKNVVFWDIKP
jgi:hypothetical protein